MNGYVVSPEATQDLSKYGFISRGTLKRLSSS